MPSLVGSEMCIRDSSDTTSTAAALTTLDGKTTVAVNATAVATITGTLAECDNALDANAAGTITGIGDVNVTYTGNASLAELIILDGLTTGTITGSTNVVNTTALLADGTGLISGHAISLQVDETTDGGAHTVTVCLLYTSPSPRD